jgi:hypothetical protein
MLHAWRQLMWMVDGATALHCCMAAPFLHVLQWVCGHDMLPSSLTCNRTLLCLHTVLAASALPDKTSLVTGQTQAEYSVHDTRVNLATAAQDLNSAAKCC